MKRPNALRLLIGALALGVSLVAQAHSPLKSTLPANDATLNTPPERITLSFKGDFRLTRITASHANRAPVVLDISHVTGFAHTFVVPLASMGAGDYRIEWRGLGKDGHVQSGAFSFTVQ
ncbi:MAG: copper resistance CopC family protein [Pseudomonadota bacterium]